VLYVIWGAVEGSGFGVNPGVNPWITAVSAALQVLNRRALLVALLSTDYPSGS